MDELLRELDALKLAFKLVKPSKILEENIRRESLLKSALYSAKIEGNTLTQKDFNEILQNELLKQIPLRRREILLVIKDHPYSSFDFIQRRFFNINPKTLHYDLKKLQEQNLIVKVGATRGAVYQLTNKSG